MRMKEEKNSPVARAASIFPRVRLIASCLERGLPLSMTLISRSLLPTPLYQKSLIIRERYRIRARAHTFSQSLLQRQTRQKPITHPITTSVRVCATAAATDAAAAAGQHRVCPSRSGTTSGFARGASESVT